MTAASFDTLKFVQRLKASGVPEAQAEAFVEAFKDAQGEAELATKHDLEMLKQELRVEIWKAVVAQTVVLIGVMVALKIFT